jgi:hypothetical protein
LNEIPAFHGSEVELQHKLDLSRQIIRYDLSQLAIHLGARLVELGIGVHCVELRMVEGIKRFQPELYVSLFPERKILEYTDGKVLNSRATNNTGGGITRICLRGRLDHTGVEKTIEGPVASGQVHRTGENAAAIIPTPETLKITPFSRKALTVERTSGTQNPSMVCSCGEKSATVEMRNVIPPMLKTAARRSS